MRGRKRHRKKIVKSLRQHREYLNQAFQKLGKILSKEVIDELHRPSFTASDEVYLEWENSTHPWWTRTKRRRSRGRRRLDCDCVITEHKVQWDLVLLKE